MVYKGGMYDHPYLHHEIVMLEIVVMNEIIVMLVLMMVMQMKIMLVMMLHESFHEDVPIVRRDERKGMGMEM